MEMMILDANHAMTTSHSAHAFINNVPAGEFMADILVTMNKNHISIEELMITIIQL
jgi:hypothetical protein